MAEPTSTSTAGLIGLFVVLFGPLAGEWALVVFAALAGSMWAVGRSDTSNKAQAAILLAKLVVAAVIFTGAVSTVMEHYLGWPATELLAPVAFIIGFIGERWQDILQNLFNAIVGRFIREQNGSSDQ
jgi:hypothetical protein